MKIIKFFRFFSFLLLVKLLSSCLFPVCPSIADTIQLSNGNIGLNFLESDLTLYQVDDYLESMEFILDPSPVWRINLYNISVDSLSEEHFIPLFSTECGGETSYFFEEDTLQGLSSLRLVWDSIPLLGAGMVEVTVSLEKGVDFGDGHDAPGFRDSGIDIHPSFDDLLYSSRWDIEITDYCDTLSVFSFDFPYLLIPSFTGDPMSGKLVLPHMSGILVPNPIKNASIKINYDRDVDSEGKEAPGKTPGMWGMQFSAIYETFPNNKDYGLFFSNDDTTFTYRRYSFRGFEYPLSTHGGNRAEVDSTEDAMTYYIRNYPLYNTVPGGVEGKNSTVPYSTYILPFKGDWLTAAKIYRPWALRQSWASKGPLHSREDFDKSFGELAFIMNVSLSKYQSIWEAFESVSLFKEFTGDSIGMGIRLHEWYDNSPTEPVPKDSIEWLVQVLQDEYDIRVAPYIHTRAWEVGVADDEIRTRFKSATINGNGDSFIDSHYGFYIMDPSSESWREKVSGWAWFAKDSLKAKDVYLDNFQGFQMCFRDDEYHEYTPGTGDFWLNEYMKIISKIRDDGKAVDPNFSMVQESKMEGLINLIDTNIILYWENENFEEFYSDKGFPLPLFVAVYHDYLASVGSTRFDWGWYATQQYQYTFTNAYSFVNGTRLSMDDDKFLLRKDPYDMMDDPEVLAKRYVKLLVGYYWVMSDYLLYGEYMSPPDIASPDVNVEFFSTWRINSDALKLEGDSGDDSDESENDGYTISLESVQGGGYLAPDSTIGVVLTNFTDDEVIASARINVKDYGLDEGFFIVEQLFPTPPSTKLLGTFSGSVYALSRTFQPRSVMAFRIVPFERNHPAGLHKNNEYPVSD